MCIELLNICIELPDQASEICNCLLFQDFRKSRMLVFIKINAGINCPAMVHAEIQIQQLAHRLTP